MSFKIILAYCSAFVLVASAARIDMQSELNRQVQQQQDIIQEHNEQIRDHQRLEIQQRAVQMQNLEDQRRVQEQMIRDQERERLDNIRQHAGTVYVTAHQPAHSYQFVTVPSSRRHFERRDDSNYNYAYAISDLTTGDIKSQQETRRGDTVQGQYTMMDADGYQRTVDYRADDRNGFDAEVRREPAAIVATPAARHQVISFDGNYAPRFDGQYLQPAATQFLAHPAIYASTSVSRRDDGQRNQYTTTTASNF